MLGGRVFYDALSFLWKTNLEYCMGSIFSSVDLMDMALAEARAGVDEGGMPFGSVLFLDGAVVSRAHNRQLQDADYFAHAEMECLKKYINIGAGRVDGAVLVATEAPCPMCAGAAVILGIRKFVIGESYHYQGALDWLMTQEVEVEVLDHKGCIDLVSEFRINHADRWAKFSAG